MRQTDSSTLPESQPYSLPKLAALGWWLEIHPDFERFFRASQTFRPGLPATQFTQILIDLERARVNIQTTPYPIIATEARRYLIEAITSVLKSFSAAIEQNIEHYQYHRQQAQKYLNLFDSMMNELGIEE